LISVAERRGFRLDLRLKSQLKKAMNNKPWLKVGKTLFETLEDLKKREPIFHRSELGTDRADYEKMVIDDFWEVGASGRRYDRKHIFEILDARRREQKPDPWQTSEFHCRELARDIYLLTYTLKQDERITRRSTIWKRTPDGWKAVYHQGTEVHD
jgi:hypothetical protein